MEEHRPKCIFRPVPCPKSSCKERVVFQDLVDHVKTHGMTWMGHDQLLTWTDVAPDREGGTWSGVVATTFESVHFIPMLTKADQTYHLWVYVVGSREEAEKYEYEDF